MEVPVPPLSRRVFLFWVLNPFLGAVLRRRAARGSRGIWVVLKRKPGYNKGTDYGE